ncbi:MAG: hypothetical protein K2K26_11525 [Muribaculaceae bacterium]|nr:hypothetical protein [Muribaculaceae bacterium]
MAEIGTDTDAEGDGKKRLTLDDLMRAVLGRMRMSLADFESLTVPELIMLYGAWGMRWPASSASAGK